MNRFLLALAIVAATIFAFGCITADIDTDKKCADKTVSNITTCGVLGQEATLVQYINSSKLDFYTADGEIANCTLGAANQSKDCTDLVQAFQKDDYCSDENICAVNTSAAKAG